MNYEEKYKEVLERAREELASCGNGRTKMLERIFPELKKSEDEKIKNRLINLIKMSSEFGGLALHKWEADEMLAWLEKQGSEPNWCHHKVDLSNCSEGYRKAYYDGWNNCNMQHSQCESEKSDVLKCLINGMKFYYEDNEEATWGTQKFSMKVKDILDWLEKQGQIKESTISQHENRTCEENDDSLTSEDEKIRKELIKHLKEGAEGYEPAGDSSDYQRWLAWLERQVDYANFRDKAQVGDRITKNEDGVLVNLSQLKRVAKPSEKQCEQKLEMKTAEESLGIDSDTYNKIVDECIFGEQKPEENKGNVGGISPNWSEEDKQYVEDTLALIGFGFSAHTIGEVQEWLHSLQDRVQPKQEWSEDDKKIINSLIDSLTRISLNTRTDSTSPNFSFYKEIDWLKSLRPQNAWKPSDEHIGLLQAIINEPNNAASESCQIVLKDILEQLKKLKEEV